MAAAAGVAARLAVLLLLLATATAAVSAQQSAADEDIAVTGSSAPQPAEPDAATATPAEVPQGTDPAATTSPAAPVAPKPAITEPAQDTEEQPAAGSAGHCPPPFDTQKYRTTTFTDDLKSTVSIHPDRPSANVPLGGWIKVRTASEQASWSGLHAALPLFEV
jgi:hypothetical protein